jgi:hypothetical protein
MSGVPIQGVEFDDIATSVMGEAFDRTCKTLRNFRSACTLREIIATRILEAARTGERDPARLHQQALIPFGIEDLSMQVVSVDRDSPDHGLRFGHARSVAIERTRPMQPSPQHRGGALVEAAFRES